jgi:hypothetical protein
MKSGVANNLILAQYRLAMSQSGIDSLSSTNTRQWRWKTALVFLVVLPLIPELVIFATSLLAQILGCTPGSEAVCTIGPGSAAGIIRNALKAGSFLGFRFSDGLAAVWLILGCWLATLGWTRLRSRLLLAFALTMVCAFVPYFGPMLSIDHLINPKCLPNEGGVGPCMIYGGNIGAVAHDTERLVWRIIAGAPIALVIFVVYAITAIWIHLRSRKRT